jgi:hypothetical protein
VLINPFWGNRKYPSIVDFELGVECGDVEDFYKNIVFRFVFVLAAEKHAFDHGIRIRLLQ